MVLRLSDNLTIENPRHHPAEEVERLRAVLASGTQALPDPHRRDFYEVHNGKRVFYVHISPVTGHVLLLASWDRDAAQASPASGQVVA